MSRILTCLDNSIYARSCAELALWAANRLKARVDVINVLDRPPATADFSAAGALTGRPDIHAGEMARDDETRRQIETQASALVDDVVARLEAGGVSRVSGEVRFGNFLETLADNEGDADVVVLGKRGEGADFVTLRLGSNLERAARASTKPVLIAARSFRPIEKALIAFDGSDNAREAVAAATRSPLLKGLPLELVWVGAETQGAREALEDAAHLLSGGGHAVSWRIVPGAPERAIPEIVAREGFGLLVMGAPSHSRLHVMVLGSTTSALLRACVIPALLYR